MVWYYLRFYYIYQKNYPHHNQVVFLSILSAQTALLFYARLTLLV